MATITGTEGHDRSDLGGTDLIGTQGNDRIYGLGGNDWIEGRGGHDTLYGGAGDYNTIKGGDGDDAVLTDGRGGWFDGGSGFDYMIFSTSTGGSFDLAAGSGRIGGGSAFSMLNFEHIATGGGNDVIAGSNARNVITSGGGHDTIEAKAGNDEVFAGAGNDVADGGARDDVLRGEAGDDTLIGGTGRDRLIGGSGYDAMWGGREADRFVFSAGDSPWSSRSDVIHDFQKGVDKIDLGALDANAHTAGNNAFHTLMKTGVQPFTAESFTAGTIAVMGTTDGGRLVLVNTSDAAPNGLDAPELVIKLEGGVDLSLSDFIL